MGYLIEKFLVGQREETKVSFPVRPVRFAAEVLCFRFDGVEQRRGHLRSDRHILCHQVFIQNGSGDPVIITNIDPPACFAQFFQWVVVNHYINTCIRREGIVAGTGLRIEHTDDLKFL